MHRSLNVTHLLLSFVFFLSMTGPVTAQTVDTEAFTPAIDSLKGRLLFMTECHEVRTNYAEHQAVISKISANFTASDIPSLILLINTFPERTGSWLILFSETILIKLSFIFH